MTNYLSINSTFFTGDISLKSASKMTVSMLSGSSGSHVIEFSIGAALIS